MSADPARFRTTPTAAATAGVRTGVGGRRWGGLAAIAAGASATVAELGHEVYERPPGAFDAGVREWALAHRTPGGLVAFEWVSRLGAPAPVSAFALLVALWLWRAGRRLGAAVVGAAPLLAVVLFNAIKQIVHRSRPEGRLLLREVTFSFPSGHAAVSAAAFGTLAWVLAREGRLSRGAAVILAVVPPLFIGLSRVYLNVHWATDVLAGWCVGVAIWAFAAGAYEWDRSRRGRAT